jgi:hypothetical protein
MEIFDREQQDIEELQRLFQSAQDSLEMLEKVSITHQESTNEELVTKKILKMPIARVVRPIEKNVISNGSLCEVCGMNCNGQNVYQELGLQVECASKNYRNSTCESFVFFEDGNGWKVGGIGGKCILCSYSPKDAANVEIHLRLTHGLMVAGYRHLIQQHKYSCVACNLYLNGANFKRHVDRHQSKGQCVRITESTNRTQN